MNCVFHSEMADIQGCGHRILWGGMGMLGPILEGFSRDVMLKNCRKLPLSKYHRQYLHICFPIWVFWQALTRLSFKSLCMREPLKLIWFSRKGFRMRHVDSGLILSLRVLHISCLMCAGCAMLGRSQKTLWRSFRSTWFFYPHDFDPVIAKGTQLSVNLIEDPLSIQKEAVS